MKITRGVAGIGLVFAFAAVACGGQSARHASHTGGVFAGGTKPLAASTAAPAAAGGSTAGTPSQTSHAQSQPAARATPNPYGTPIPQYAPGTQPAPATATLSAACVKPGGIETLTIKTVAGYSVTFDAQYANGGDGQKYGGMGYGYASNDGTFGGTWVVSPSAPLGPVTVWVAVAHGQYSAFRQPTFTVAESC